MDELIQLSGATTADGAMPTTPAQLPVSQAKAHPGRVRKRLVRRSGTDRSQALRRTFQIAFVVLNLAIGIQFYLFVRFYESGGAGRQVARPAGVDGWLPIAGMMNLKYFVSTGTMPHIHPSALILFATFVIMSLVLRKAFCGWLCPVGTLSEALWKFGRGQLRMNWQLPRWLDVPLRGIKYLLFFLFLYAVAGMSAVSIQAFLESPYGIVADVKMLNFFRDMGQTAAITIAALVVLSVLVKNFWCRYLCPYGAALGLAALFSPARIRRDADRCIDCAKCAKACPALLPVDKLASVRSAECMACLECVAVCPAEGALQMGFPRRRKLAPWAVAAGIALLFISMVTAARLTGHWQTEIPPDVYRSLIPRVGEFGHPGR